MLYEVVNPQSVEHVSYRYALEYSGWILLTLLHMLNGKFRMT